MKVYIVMRDGLNHGVFDSVEKAYEHCLRLLPSAKHIEVFDPVKKLPVALESVLETIDYHSVVGFRDGNKEVYIDSRTVV